MERKHNSNGHSLTEGVGFDVGLRDGAFEGIFVGWSVGIFVGCNTIKKKHIVRHGKIYGTI